MEGGKGKAARFENRCIGCALNCACVHGINITRCARSEMAQCNERVHYIGCAGQTLLLPSGDINGTLIPDG